MALKIVRGLRQSPVRAVIYGTEGIGKSTLASQFPQPVMLDTEDGTGRIDCARVICQDALTLEGAMLDLAGDAQGFRTVVIDSADWMERHIIHAMLKNTGKKSIEDFGFGKGYTMLAEAFSRVLSNADQMVAKGLNVVFVAHSKIARTSPPDETDGYDRYELKLTKQVSPLLKEWCDLLLFCNYRMKVVEGSDGRKKAKGGRERVMYADRTAAFDAKNRFQLPAEMPMEVGQLRSVFEGRSLFDTVLGYIAEAASADQLTGYRKRIDALNADGKLTSEQHSDLCSRIKIRGEALEPSDAVA